MFRILILCYKNAQVKKLPEMRIQFILDRIRSASLRIRVRLGTRITYAFQGNLKLTSSSHISKKVIFFSLTLFMSYVCA
jgi:hypothetical protein